MGRQGLHRSEQDARARTEQSHLRAVRVGPLVDAAARSRTDRTRRTRSEHAPVLALLVRAHGIRLAEQGAEACDPRLAARTRRRRAVVGRHRGQRTEARPAVDSRAAKGTRRDPIRGARLHGRRLVRRRHDHGRADGGRDQRGDHDRAVRRARVDHRRGARPRAPRARRAARRLGLVDALDLDGAARRGCGGRAHGRREGSEGGEEWTQYSEARPCGTRR